MILNIVKIGNSRGIRLSKALLDEYNLRDTLEIILKETHMEIHSGTQIRAGWEDAFKRMAADQAEERLLPDVFEDEDI